VLVPFSFLEKAIFGSSAVIIRVKYTVSVRDREQILCRS
jgi:hypothetical protein